MVQLERYLEIVTRKYREDNRRLAQIRRQAGVIGIRNRDTHVFGDRWRKIREKLARSSEERGPKPDRKSGLMEPNNHLTITGVQWQEPRSYPHFSRAQLARVPVQIVPFVLQLSELQLNKALIGIYKGTFNSK